MSSTSVTLGSNTLAFNTGANSTLLVGSTKTLTLGSAASTVCIVDSATGASVLNMNSNKITNLADPVAAQDAATKNYVTTTAAIPSGATGAIQIKGASGLTNDTAFTFDTTGHILTVGNLNLSTNTLTTTTAGLSVGASSGAVTINSANTLTIANTTAATTALVVSNATDSTTTTSGAVTIAGGLGVAKAIYADTLSLANTTADNSLNVTNPTDSTSTTTGAVKITGGLGVAKSIKALSATAGNITCAGNTITSTGGYITMGPVGTTVGSGQISITSTSRSIPTLQLRMPSGVFSTNIFYVDYYQTSAAASVDGTAVGVFNVQMTGSGVWWVDSIFSITNTNATEQAVIQSLLAVKAGDTPTILNSVNTVVYSNLVNVTYGWVVGLSAASNVGFQITKTGGALTFNAGANVAYSLVATS